jgi:thymidylate synthase (FAD)
MRITTPSATIELAALEGDDALRFIERIGRVAWKSEGLATETSAPRFIKMLISKGHESVLEHLDVTVRFIVDRGVSHEIVRHRIASFTQESTRYCDYVKVGDVEFIRPPFWADDDIRFKDWTLAMSHAEGAYNRLRAAGATPQEARSVLPNSLKTELVMTANLREWRHFFKLRAAPPAHPQMRQVAGLLLLEFQRRFPVFFDDILS